MIVGEILSVALGAIRANKLRSFLTMLGIIIGIAAVITMVALGEGAQRQVQERLQRLGTNVLTVRPGRQFWGGLHRGDNELETDDALVLSAEAAHVRGVAPEMERDLRIEFGTANASVEVIGTWPSYFQIHDHAPAAGRLFTASEDRGRRRVAVLGARVGEELGLDTRGGGGNVGEDPGLEATIPLLGQTLWVRGIPFEVIGVLEEKGDAAWMDPDEAIYIPLSTAQFRVFGTERVRSIYVQAASTNDINGAIVEIDRVLRREHRLRPGEESDFTVRNQTTLLDTFEATTRTFTFLLAGIAAVSLLVGGIGIMNIMLVSVTERTREIGLRKALGARRREIMLQFLIEALVLCVAGGALGVAAGAGGAYMLQRFAEWNTAVAPESVGTALVFSAAVGLFFGIWPARRAARLDPIVALRHE